MREPVHSPTHTDIVSESVWMPELPRQRIERDMIAVRVTDELPARRRRLAAYFAQHVASPDTRRLVAHDCIRYGFSSGIMCHGGFRW